MPKVFVRKSTGGKAPRKRLVTKRPQGTGTTSESNSEEETPPSTPSESNSEEETPESQLPERSTSVVSEGTKNQGTSGKSEGASSEGADPVPERKPFAGVRAFVRKSTGGKAPRKIVKKLKTK